MSLLFTPLKIGAITVPNRIVMAPMVRLGALFSEELKNTQGQVTQGIVDHYRQRAAGGVGIVIVEATTIDAQGLAWPQGLRLWDDKHIDDLSRIASAIRAEGAVAAIQLVHGGPKALAEATGQHTVGPSPIAPSAEYPVPDELSVSQIQEIQVRFADAAERATQAGFQAVEVHGAHGYLLDTFLSPTLNQREDAYGGTWERRMRFMTETCQVVAARVHPCCAVGCRISPFTQKADGFDEHQLGILLAALENAKTDLVHISTRGAFKQLFDSDKTVGQIAGTQTALPRIVTGNIETAQDAERLLSENHADLIGLGRALLTDPDWARHVRESI